MRVVLTADVPAVTDQDVAETISQKPARPVVQSSSERVGPLVDLSTLPTPRKGQGPHVPLPAAPTIIGYKITRPKGEIPWAGSSGARSGHRIDARLRCKRYAGLRYEETIGPDGERYPPILPHDQLKFSTSNGTLVHITLALLYNRIKAWQEGTDQNRWAHPADFIRWYAHELGGAALAALPETLELWDVYQVSAKRDAHECKIVGVEQVIKVFVKGVYAHTRSVDLIVEVMTPYGPRIMFIDHKTAAKWGVVQHRCYTADGQFVDYDYMGPIACERGDFGVGKIYGGAMINALVSARTWKGRRQAPYIHRIAPMPAPLFLAEREDVLFEEYDGRHESYLRGDPVRKWRGPPTSKLCGKQAWMGACSAFDFCRVGGPGMERLDWPLAMAEGEPSEAARRRLTVMDIEDLDTTEDVPF